MWSERWTWSSFGCHSVLLSRSLFVTRTVFWWWFYTASKVPIWTWSWWWYVKHSRVWLVESIRVRGLGFALFLSFSWTLKITFHFHPIFFIRTQIDKSRTKCTHLMKIQCDVIRCTCSIVSDCSAGLHPFKGTWLRTLFFLDKRDILHIADRTFTNL